MYMKEKIQFKKIAKMTVTDHNLAVQLRWSKFSEAVIFAIFKIGFSLSYIFFSRNLWFPCDKSIDYYRTNACAI